jgi:hypothetical protein
VIIWGRFCCWWEVGEEGRRSDVSKEALLTVFGPAPMIIASPEGAILCQAFSKLN